MNVERLEQLAQGELDGTATERELEELRALLSASEEARMRYGEIRNVFQILAAQRSLEPPPSLKPRILGGLPRPTEARRGKRFWWSRPLGRGRRYAPVYALAAGVVAALIFTAAARQVWITRSDSMSGAIGAAKRYQSPQMGAEDVALDDAQVATFIQSDAFRRLATDPKFREAARSESFGRVVQSNGLREVSARVDLGKVLAHAAIQDLLRSPEFARAVESGRLKEMALGTPELLTSIESAQIKQMLNAKGMTELARNPEFLNLFRDALKTDGFTQLMEGLTADNLAAVRDVANSPEMLSVLSNATYREAAQHTELSRAASAGLEAAVQRIEE